MVTEALLTAAESVRSLGVWRVVIATALFGVFVGAVPGLTATMAVALFVPMAYWLGPVEAIAGVVTIVACAIFSGDIPTVLLRIPGTPASAAYADEAYLLGRSRGASGVLVLMLGSSVLGGLFGAVVLMALGPQLAGVAAAFSAPEYFWIYLLGLSCAVIVSRQPPSHALIGLFIGLLLATIGLSAAHGEARFTFQRPELAQGVGFIPAMIGLFGLSEVMRNLVAVEVAGSTQVPRGFGFGSLRSLLRRKGSLVRSGVIGAGVGMLPGAGADMASWASAAASGRRSGGGELDAERRARGMISDATAANSAALAGAWIPTLVFGIPGDSITAIVIGILMMKNVTPGPAIFVEQGPLVYSIYMLFIMANLVLIPVGLLVIGLSGWVVRAPRRVLMPVIAVFCVVGAYAINGSYFDVAVMVSMGILGFGLERVDVPLAPVVLGIILGGPLEERFVQTLTGSDGALIGLVDRPGSLFLAAVAVALWGWLLVQWGRELASGKGTPGG
jgi:putative tricarboxylic transport membrane protein